MWKFSLSKRFRVSWRVPRQMNDTKKNLNKNEKMVWLCCACVCAETKTLRSLLSRCGGSLISRRHVVTAGHCVARATPRQVHVTLGDYVINSAVEPLPAYTFGVRKIDVHPYFKFTPQADRFDVSVLTLERPVHLMPHIGMVFGINATAHELRI